MRILGIDPGLRHTGWGVISKQGHALSYVAAGAIHPPEKADLSARLKHLHEELVRVLELYRPDSTAIEQTFVSINAASTLKLGNARGALLLTLALHGTPPAEYDATRIKKSVTGSGRADKLQMSHMVKLLLPTCDVNASADAIDALAVAITHAHYGHSPLS
jgi:crossover junction endodeoxyribonuclease RuvC